MGPYLSKSLKRCKCRTAPLLLNPNSQPVFGLGPCPLCGTAERHMLRHFEGQPPTYVLCKWCGYRHDLTAPEDSFTLAIPVGHRCEGGGVVITWVEYGPTDTYRDLRWTCRCGVRLRVFDSLRPYPRFAAP